MRALSRARRDGRAARRRRAGAHRPRRQHDHRARAARRVAGGRLDVLRRPPIRRACSRSTPRPARGCAEHDRDHVRPCLRWPYPEALPRIAAPASSRRRTRWRRFASATRTATGWSSSTSSCRPTASRSCCTTPRSIARPTARGRADALTVARALAARRRRAGIRRRTPASRCRRSPPSRAGAARTTSPSTSRSSPRRVASAKRAPPIALDAATLWAGADVPPLLSSFSEAALDAARDAVPELPRAWLGRAAGPTTGASASSRLGCIALDAQAHAARRRRASTRSTTPACASPRGPSTIRRASPTSSDGASTR